MQIDSISYDYAADNMNYDNNLVAALQRNTISSFLRFYIWKNRGLTQSEKRCINTNLNHIDHAYRVTGGGLVFHCPGDIVFSYGAPINTPNIPKKLKDRCMWFATIIKEGLHNIGISVELAKNVNQINQDIYYCSSYHNPYECMLDNQKISGIALKKTRQYIIFQGVIHIEATNQWFHDIHPDYKRYFTTGISHCFETNVHQKIETLITFYKEKFNIN